jgi:hypothetical protein
VVTWRASLGTSLALAVSGLATLASPQPRPAAPSPTLLERVLAGVEQAEQAHPTACGTLTETRSSPLLSRPLRLQGSFCTAGTDRFRVEYRGERPARVVYNRGTLNVSADGKRTEVMEVGSSVRRAQSYFSGKDASKNLQRDFSITVSLKADRYALLMRPVSGRIARRVTRVAVELGRDDFLPRRIEIDGKSGVNSVFDIRIETLDQPLDEEEFRVYRP